MSMSSYPDPVAAGAWLNYTITVQNQWSVNAENVVVSDSVDTILQNPEYSIDSGQNWYLWTGSLSLGTIIRGNPETGIDLPLGHPFIWQLRSKHRHIGCGYTDERRERLSSNFCYSGYSG